MLDVIADATAADRGALRAACEVREAAYRVSDLLVGTDRDTLRDLDDLVVGRLWWR